MQIKSYNIFQSKSGARSAQVVDSKGQSFLVHSAVNPEQENDLLAIADVWGDFILCLGTGLGYHLAGLTKTDRSRTVVLVDNCTDFLEASAKRIEHPLLEVIKIPLWDRSLLKRGQHSALTVLNGGDLSIQVVRHPASYRFAREKIDKVCNAIFSFQRNKQKAPHKSGNHPITPRIINDHRVLLLFGQHFLQQELLNGLRDMNVSYMILDYENKLDSAEWESLSLKALQKSKPTLILTVNMKGLDTEGILLSYAKDMGIPVHTWFVDDPRPIALAYNPEQWPLIKAWTWEKSYINWLAKEGFSTPEWLPLAGDPSIFQPGKRTSTKKFALVFTGSAMTGESLEKIRRSFLWNDDVEKMAWSKAKALHEGRSHGDSLLHGLNLPFRDARNLSWMECLILHMASHLRRRDTLQPLLDKGLVLAGDAPGWKTTFPGYDRVMTDIDYRRELCSHYQKSKVQVNLTSLQMPTAVNQRVFDVPLAGSFVLTDAQEDVKKLFSEDNIVVFNNTEELLDKSDWYGRNDEKRNQLNSRLREEVLQHHTYSHRLNKILACCEG